MQTFQWRSRASAAAGQFNFSNDWVSRRLCKLLSIHQHHSSSSSSLRSQRPKRLLCRPDGEPRTATPMFMITQLLSSDWWNLSSLINVALRSQRQLLRYVHTGHKAYWGRPGAQDGHLDFHTAPEMTLMKTETRRPKCHHDHRERRSSR